MGVDELLIVASMPSSARRERWSAVVAQLGQPSKYWRVISISGSSACGSSCGQLAAERLFVLPSAVFDSIVQREESRVRM